MRLHPRHRLFSLFALCALLLAVVGAAAAQTGPSISAIVSFTSSVTGARLADVEAGTVTTTLSWHIVNVATGQRVALDTFVQNGWQSVLTEGEALSPVGEREVVVRDPLNFGQPTFRLTLISGRSVVDQQYLVLPIVTPEDETPSITSFTTETGSLDLAALRQANSRVVVSWEVADRIPNTNLVFEQVVSAEQTVSVELPRATLYVFSAGSGPIQPVAPADEATVRLRLSIVNVISGDIYDTAEIVIPIGGASAATSAPAATPSVGDATAIELPDSAATTAAPTNAPTAEATVQAAQETGPTIAVFTVDPTTTAPGTNVTIAWNVGAATNVQIQEILADDTIGITYVSLPALGAISVPVPAGGAPGFSYRLTAADDAGGVTTQDVAVAVSAG